MILLTTKLSLLLYFALPCLTAPLSEESDHTCTRQGYFGYPSSCTNTFYRCVKFNQYSSDFTVFEYECPKGLVFYDEYEVCVAAEQCKVNKT